MPFTLVIFSKGFKQKQFIFNFFVTNLSDIRDFVGRIPKKQLKAEEIEILKKFVMEKLIKKDEAAVSDKKIPTYLYKVNQSIVP